MLAMGHGQQFPIDAPYGISLPHGTSSGVGAGDFLCFLLLQSPTVYIVWYCTVHLKARSLHVVSIVASVFRQKPYVSSSVWGRSGLYSLKLQVERHGSFILEQCFSIVLQHIPESSGGLVGKRKKKDCQVLLPEFLIQRGQGEVGVFAFLTSSRVRLMLLVHGPYFGNHGFRALF